jgi:ATP-dependent RNA helicase MSS116
MLLCQLAPRALFKSSPALFTRGFLAVGRAFDAVSHPGPEVSASVATAPDATAATAVTPKLLSDEGILDHVVYDAIIKAGFTDFTKVQQNTIGPALKVNKGLVCRARTGTGKTLAFGIPSIQHAVQNIDKDRKVQSLIITPTRDLALQIEGELTKVVNKLPPKIRLKLTIASHIGGTKANQLHPRAAPKILIATPGRLNANLENPSFAACFSDLKFRVYDESDRLLDIGFTEELYRIDSILKGVQKSAEVDQAESGDDAAAAPQFSSLLFSATVDSTVQKFAAKMFGRDYQFIDCVDKGELEAHHLVEQTLVKTNTLTELYLGILNFVSDNLVHKHFKAVMFLPTTASVDYTYELLLSYVANDGIYNPRNIMLLHGKRLQAQRDRTVRNFSKAKEGLLITTDVGSRGLDFKDVTDVVQISPSQSPADYIHKIGRTARAGKSGKAVIFLTAKEMPFATVLKQRRKVEFANVLEYQPNDEVNRKIQQSASELEPTDAESFCKSYMSYVTNIKGKYQLQHRVLIEQAANLYKFLLNNEDAKMRADDRFTKVQLHLNSPEASKVFDYHNLRRGTLRDGRSSGYPSRDAGYRRDSRDDSYSGGYRKNASTGGYRDSHSSRDDSYGGGYKRDSPGGYRKNSSGYRSESGGQRGKRSAPYKKREVYDDYE